MVSDARMAVRGRNRRLSLLLGAVALSVGATGSIGMDRAWAASARSGAPQDPSIVKVETGTLKGVIESQVINFRGIPYAAPPVGKLRWASPKPAAAWPGVRDASKFAPICPQDKDFNEDCLYLNVMVPRGGAKGTKPVMVWIHGGGISSGTPNTYDATRMVTQGDVIFVGIAFRVNVFGFFGVDGLEGSGSFGYQDQQAALRWIQRNIAKFGGDPRNVTLFGESGGGVSTCAQLVSPGSKGLFAKVIMQSGTCSLGWAKNGPSPGLAAGDFYEPSAMIEAAGGKTAERLGCAGTDKAAVIACLRKVPAEKIAAEGINYGLSAVGNKTLPIDPAAALAQGKYNKVAVLTGFTRDEARSIASGFTFWGKPITDQNYTGLIQESFDGKAGEVLARYPMNRFKRGVFAWSAVHTDRMYACPQLHDARTLSRHVPVYAYEFADPDGIGVVPFMPDLPSGSSHSSELPLLFDLPADGRINLATGEKLPLSEAQKALGKTMIQYWTRFAWASDPNGAGLPHWPKFDEAKGVVQILAPGSGEIKPAMGVDEAHQCDFWEPWVLASASRP